MACSKIAHVTTNNYTDGAAFMFDFSRGLNLVLERVEFKNKQPVLVFSRTAANVPTLTEEHVAVVAKLVMDKEDPMFLYRSFKDGHPFEQVKRLFKGYFPAILKGTVFGGDLSEVDWLMKGLHVGVRSNSDKTKFRPWAEDSNLEGLRTRVDFKDDMQSTVMMRCESIDVFEEKDALSFVGMPKMRIDCVIKSHNVEYSQYITERFDSVAYHDAPLFLRMQEIMKLIHAIKWLHKKMEAAGMSFSSNWIDEHLQRAAKQKPVYKPIDVKVPPEEAERIMKEIIENKYSKESGTALAVRSDFQVEILDKTVSQDRFKVEAQVSYTKGGERITSVCEVRGSFNDYDFVFEGEDPNQVYDNDDVTGEPLQPNVSSWNELYNETVPQPCVAFPRPDGSMGPMVTGGVSTVGYSTNPVRSKPKPAAEEYEVTAGARVRQPYTQPTRPLQVRPPNPSVGVNTKKSEMLGRANIETETGHTNFDGSSFHLTSRDGSEVRVKKDMTTRFCKEKSSRQALPAAGEIVQQHEICSINGKPTHLKNIDLIKTADGQLLAKIDNEKAPLFVYPCPQNTNTVVELRSDGTKSLPVKLDMQLA